MALPEARTLPRLLDEMAGRFPDRNFVTDGERRVSYAEFRLQVRALAKSFHALGVRKNDKVALLLGNQLEWLQVYFAVAALGAVLVAVNTWWRRSELRHALAITDSTVLVMADRFGSCDYTAELAAIGDLATELPALRHIVCLGEDPPPAALSFQALRQLGANVDDRDIDAAGNAVRPDDVALIVFTSGSTGRSKAAMLAHRGLIENPCHIGERMHVTEHDRLLLVLSLFWSASACNALFNLMTHGGSVVLARRFDAGAILKQIQDERCTVFYTLPNIVHALYQHPDRGRYDLSSLRTGICRAEVVHLLAEMGAQEYCTTYGLTEAYGNSCVADGRLPLEFRRAGAGFPLPGTELQIVDPATRRPVPPGMAGEVRLRGYVMAGYYNDPERTREAIDDEGWLYTGDLAILDERGFRFQCRLKEMIKTGGINVTPGEVEDLLQAHPGVLQAVVVGVPDPVREEIVAAMVVPRDGHPLTAQELAGHCRAAAAAYKVPRFIDIVDAGAMPLTDTGKVSKRHVQERLARKYLEADAR
ncbi:AMP-binding protein [Pigmentiphaga soli]|uniref:AMP-binding protein n=1 Tax=Pigmentiphaga soli TaxID=1007095 RepID=A0ABP8GSW5_9BURK